MRFSYEEMAAASTASAEPSRTKPDRLEWFRDLGLGIFVHWSVDVQLGCVISHSLVGASEDYVQRYFRDLPAMFNPKQFDPEEWVRQFKLAGAGYVVFTTKHHNGFCMWDTETTDFNVINTPFKRDVTRELFDALRAAGLGVGVYFSPTDYHVCHRQGLEISLRPECWPTNNPGLMETNRRQLRELLTRYGDVDIVFFDGPAAGLKNLCWDLQADIVITRGDLPTPEQRIPDEPEPGPWESCFTMGTQWQFKPANESYKSGEELIQMLIETRAKGGNLLLNVGPEPTGALPWEQQRFLQEIGLWMFINHEAIRCSRPCQRTREGETWFMQSKDGKTLFLVPTDLDWMSRETALPESMASWNLRGRRGSVTLRGLHVEEGARVSVLGHDGRLLEYCEGIDVAPRIERLPDGVCIHLVNAHRITNAWDWPHPIVIRIEGARL